jgi:hypothetical protein
MGSHNPGTTLINKGKEMLYTKKRKNIPFQDHKVQIHDG